MAYSHGIKDSDAQKPLENSCLKIPPLPKAAIYQVGIWGYLGTECLRNEWVLIWRSKGWA